MNKIRTFLQNKTSVSLQFFKYCMAGGFATATHLLAFTGLNETILPADVGQIGSLRGWNFLGSNMIAFMLANLVAYLANRTWVFQSGRHGRLAEILKFYLVSAVAFVAGTPLGSIIVARFAINEYYVFILVLVLSIMVNFFGRKYWVFLH